MDRFMTIQQFWIILVCIANAVGRGFSDPCPGPEDLTAVRSTETTFTSPNYPENYPHNSECEWRISTKTKGDVIKVQVEDSELEKQFGAYGCAFDHVSIYDGLGTSSKRLGRWCGDSKPSYISSGSEITVVFHSDSSSATSGFKISYVSGPAEYFRETDRANNGTNMMGMVGYLILILALLCGAMLAIRITLNRVRWCKCMERPRQRVRAFFIRRPASDQGTSTAPEVFVLPVSPPSYEESGGGFDEAPPPYSAIAMTPVNMTTLNMTTFNLTTGTTPEVALDNPAFDPGRDLEDPPPPPYERVPGDTSAYTGDSAQTCSNTATGTGNSPNIP